MKLTKTELDLVLLPPDIRKYFADADIVYDSSCASDAKVYYADTYGGCFLKIADRGSLIDEMTMARYFYSKGLGAEIIDYKTYEGRDYLLTKKLEGYDCTEPKLLAKPERLTKVLAENLRKLHDTDFSDCPFSNVTEKIQHSAVFDRPMSAGRIKLYEYGGFGSSGEAVDFIQKHRRFAKDCNALIHGDYCMPNIILKDDYTLSGFIDLGLAGGGDRNYDLFWSLWSLYFNLGTRRYDSLFIDTYGKELVDHDAVRFYAALSAFTD